MVPSQEVVESMLSPIEGGIIGVFENAWADWWSNLDRYKYNHPSVRATMIWHRMTEHAKSAFEGNKDIRVIEKDNTFYYLYKDEILFRLKKGNENGLTRNYPTQTALAFHDPQSELFGDLPEIKRVDIVYALNNLETDIEKIMVVARNADQIAWTYSLQREEGATITDITPLHPQLPKRKKLFAPKIDVVSNTKEE